MLLKIEKIPVNSQAVENEIAVKVGDLVEPEVAAAVATVGGEPVDWMPDGAYTADGERVAKLEGEINLDGCLEQLAAYDMQRAKVEPENDGYRVTRWHHPAGRKDDFFVPGPVAAAVVQMIRWDQESTANGAVGPWGYDETALILAVAESKA